MPVFLVAYDLNVEGRDYAPFQNAILQSPGYCSIAKTAWLISTEETAAQVFSRLAPQLEQRDRLLVIEVTAHYQGWLAPDRWDWIKRFLG